MCRVIESTARVYLYIAQTAPTKEMECCDLNLLLLLHVGITQARWRLSLQ
nr:MAG TPA: hypothetical protein [Caudoviricetes sp.]